MEAQHKKVLKAISLELRHLLEGSYDGSGRWHPGDLEQRLAAIGVRRDREPVKAGELPHLSPADQKARQVVDAYLQLRAEAGVDRGAAVAEFVRETAYTWANRLLALRCMEARELIDEVILQKPAYGGRSLEHHRLAQRQPALCAGEDDGLLAVLDAVFAAQARHLPMLFDPAAPGVALKPSASSLKRCMALLSGTEAVLGQAPATTEIFKAPDAFGWAYQYWNTEEKERVFDRVRTQKGAKIEGPDIIPTTQLYTEPYMVKFLVQNSLGAIWMKMHPESRLCEKWEHYVHHVDRVPVEEKRVADMTFLDPACGSGHFLLEAFDLFYDMYVEEARLTEPGEICRSILTRNLHGIDIDERSIQIAEVALWMKASEKQLDFGGRPTNLVATGFRIPKRDDHVRVFLSKHPEEHPLRFALPAIFESLEHANEFGSLLQIEEAVEAELNALRRSDPLLTTNETAAVWKTRILDRLRDHLDLEAISADMTQAFFGRSARKVLALFDVLSKTYDVVGMNPPFMHNRNIAPHIREFLSHDYPAFSLDLCFAFLARGCMLTTERGIVAMVTQRSFLFTQHYTNAREKLLSTTPPEIVADLGPGAFGEISGEKVNVVLLICSAHAQRVHVLDVSDSDSKAASLKTASHIVLDIKEVQALPRFALLYKLPSSIRFLFRNTPPARTFMDLKSGMITCDNSRFLRYQWETVRGLRWRSYAKGGSYCKWYGNNEWRVDWEHSGARIKTIAQERYGSVTRKVANERYYFNEGVTFSLMGGSALSGRLLEPTGSFDISGSSIFPMKTAGYGTCAILAWINSRIVTLMARELNPTLSFQVGDLALIPAPSPERLNTASTLASALVSHVRATSRKPIEVGGYRTSDLGLELQEDTYRATLEGVVELAVLDAYDLPSQQIHDYFLSSGPVPGWLPIVGDNYFLPRPLTETSELSRLVSAFLDSHERQTVSPQELGRLKQQARVLFEGGLKARANEDAVEIGGNDGSEDVSIDACSPVPCETFIEGLSVVLGIHPISVYHMIEEGIRTENWRCFPEERRIMSDRLTVTILRLLGHCWPAQVEAAQLAPDWADPDGIIPLTEGIDEVSLASRVRKRITADFGGGNAPNIEREFAEVIGKPLDQWLAMEFFKQHVSQFKKRPIAWQIQSGKFTARRKPAFACLIYYQKLDGDILPKVRTQYVGPLRQRLETELRSIETTAQAARSERQEKRRAELEDQIEELRQFDAALAKVIEEGFASKQLTEIAKRDPLDKWCSLDGRRPAPASREAFLQQESAYVPDINDGVRVNIAPLQKAGLLAADVLAKKDLDKAIADRAQWRADERRWCREGKLPQPGWWLSAE